MPKWDTCVEENGVTYCWDEEKECYVVVEYKVKKCVMVPSNVASKITTILANKSKSCCEIN